LTQLAVDYSCIWCKPDLLFFRRKPVKVPNKLLTSEHLWNQKSFEPTTIYSPHRLLTVEKILRTSCMKITPCCRHCVPRTCSLHSTIVQNPIYCIPVTVCTSDNGYTELAGTVKHCSRIIFLNYHFKYNVTSKSHIIVLVLLGIFKKHYTDLYIFFFETNLQGMLFTVYTCT